VRFPRGDERGREGRRRENQRDHRGGLTPLAHRTLFQRECREQTITNSANEALQYIVENASVADTATKLLEMITLFDTRHRISQGLFSSHDAASKVPQRPTSHSWRRFRCRDEIERWTDAGRRDREEGDESGIPLLPRESSGLDYRAYGLGNTVIPAICALSAIP